MKKHAYCWKRRKVRRPPLGFTLLELTIALVMLALILGGILGPLATRIESAERQKTQSQLEEITEALDGFAVTSGRLPCPDTNNDGSEEQPNTDCGPGLVPGQSILEIDCPQQEGELPHVTLGVVGIDVWGSRYRYRVSREFSQRKQTFSTLNCTPPSAMLSETAITLGSTGNITVRTRADDPATVATSEAKFASNLITSAPAVVISFGKNSWGAKRPGEPTRPAPPVANVDETANLATVVGVGPATKWSRIVKGQDAVCSDTAEGVPLCEFDDMVVWLSPNTLFNRMVTTGKLP